MSQHRQLDSFTADVEIICADCRTPFLFSIGEQRFYAERGYRHPKRCRTCRQERAAHANGARRPASA